MAKKRTIYDVDEEKIEFINKFIIDKCLKIEPNIDVTKLITAQKITAIELKGEKYQYFFNNKIPLLFVDLKLLIDGV